jgi:hypothetical protein
LRTSTRATSFIADAAHAAGDEDAVDEDAAGVLPGVVQLTLQAAEGHHPEGPALRAVALRRSEAEARLGGQVRDLGDPRSAQVLVREGLDRDRHFDQRLRALARGDDDFLDVHGRRGRCFRLRLRHSRGEQAGARNPQAVQRQHQLAQGVALARKTRVGLAVQGHGSWS